MSLRSLLLLFTLVALLGGCAEMRERKQREHEQEAAEEIMQAELHEQRGELHAAADAYRRAAETDPAQTAARAKAERLAKQVVPKSEDHYRRGLRELRSSEHQALRSFNRALRANPDHEQAGKQADTLLKRPKIAAELKRHVDELERAFKGYGHRGEEIPAIERRLETVLALDARNRTARSVRKDLDKDRKRLGLIRLAKPEESRKPAEESHKPEELKPGEAARPAEAEPAPEPVPEPAPAESHGATDAAALAGQVRQQLAGADCPGALGPWQSLQAGRSEPTAARQLAELEAEIRPALKPTLDQGRRLFDQKKFDEALVPFRCALRFDPANDLARLYVRKIESRLKTIEGLE